MRHALFAALLLLLPVSAAAATLNLPGIGNPLTISVSPTDIIEPNATVTLTAQSYALDLNRSTIAWVVNGVHDASGDNSSTFSVKVGGLGSETKVTVLVGGANDVTAQADIVLRPAGLELLWESDSYTPPLYRGRALPSPGTNVITDAEVHFVLPGGGAMDPKDIIYTWSVDNRQLAGASGRGRTSAKIPITNLFGDSIVSVTAASVDGSFSASRSARVPRVEPILELYRQHPLLGIDYGSALGPTTFFSDAEVTVAALPYFVFAGSPTDPSLTYTWQVGGKSVPSDATNPFLVTLSLADQTIGSTPVSAMLLDAVNSLQSASGQWMINLSGSAPGSQTSSPFPTQ